MSLSLVINSLIAITGILNNKKSKNKLNVKIKANDFLLILIPIFFIFKSLNITILFFGIITIIYFTKINVFVDLDKKIYQKNLKKLITYWPLIFITSILSFILFGNFEAQEIVYKIKMNEKIFLLFFSSIIIAPIFEEIFFRGIIYVVLKKRIGVFFSIILSSIFFSFVHSNIYSFGVLFVVGLICAIEFERTNKIINTIFIHSQFNLIMFFLIIIK